MYYEWKARRVAASPLHLHGLVERKTRQTRAIENMSASHANGDYFRVRFQEGYVFRLQARDIDELRELAANHFWWGDQKPPVSEVKLSLKSRKNDPKVWYAVEAPQGYPKGQVADDSFWSLKSAKAEAMMEKALRNVTSPSSPQLLFKVDTETAKAKYILVDHNMLTTIR